MLLSIDTTTHLQDNAAIRDYTDTTQATKERPLSLFHFSVTATSSSQVEILF